MSYIAITKLFSPVSNRDKFRVLVFALVFVLDKDVLAQKRLDEKEQLCPHGRCSM